VRLLSWLHFILSWPDNNGRKKKAYQFGYDCVENSLRVNQSSILDKIDKVKHYIKIQTHITIILRFWSKSSIKYLICIGPNIYIYIYIYIYIEYIYIRKYIYIYIYIYIYMGYIYLEPQKVDTFCKHVFITSMCPDKIILELWHQTWDLSTLYGCHRLTHISFLF